MIKYSLIFIIFCLIALPAVAQTPPPQFTSQDHPVFAVAAYYNAINRGEYARAYDYWRGGEPGGATLAQFTAGFADTQSVEALVRLPLRYGVAAGSTYAEMPIILISTLKNGTQQIYGGCFMTRKANIPAGNATEPDPNWYLYSASFAPVEAVDFTLAAEQCQQIESFPLADPYLNPTHPIDTLTTYYDAIARGTFDLAYGYWGGNNTRQSVQQFAEGFAGTANIGVIVDLNFLIQGAAGSTYAEIPVLVTATSNNVPQWFAGCYTFRHLNVPVGNATQPDPNWYLYQVQNTAAASAAEGVEMVTQACDSARG